MVNLLSTLCSCLSGISIGYFLFLWIHCRRIPADGWIWPAAAVVFGGNSTVFFLLSRLEEAVLQSFEIQRMLIIYICMIIIITMFCGVGIYVIHLYGNKQAGPGAEYLIILGAGVNGTVPSKTLMGRIEKAYEYLKKNPDTIAVLSGGKGTGEDITEAVCMKRELLVLGINPERLIMEEESTTTKENLLFSRWHIEMRKGTSLTKDTQVVIVTNEFHALRSRLIAKETGYGWVETLTASSSFQMKPHYYGRELLAWVKFGIIRLLKNKTETGDKI